MFQICGFPEVGRQRQLVIWKMMWEVPPTLSLEWMGNENRLSNSKHDLS